MCPQSDAPPFSRLPGTGRRCMQEGVLYTVTHWYTTVDEAMKWMWVVTWSVSIIDISVDTKSCACSCWPMHFYLCVTPRTRSTCVGAFAFFSRALSAICACARRSRVSPRHMSLVSAVALGWPVVVVGKMAKFVCVAGCIWFHRSGELKTKGAR